VNTIPAARSYMLIHNVQNIIVCHITIGCLGDIVQNYVKVYNVAHQASNNLLSNKHEGDWAVTTLLRCSLTCLDRHRKPNPQTCLQILPSQDYQRFNSTRYPPLVGNSPLRCTVSWNSEIFDDVGHSYLESVA